MSILARATDLVTDGPITPHGTARGGIMAPITPHGRGGLRGDGMAIGIRGTIRDIIVHGITADIMDTITRITTIIATITTITTVM